jgi:hypothetical protein
LALGATQVAVIAARGTCCELTGVAIAARINGGAVRRATIATFIARHHAVAALIDCDLGGKIVQTMLAQVSQIIQKRAEIILTAARKLRIVQAAIGRYGSHQKTGARALVAV